MVELARLRARDELGPVHRDTTQRGRRVEGAALLEAQRTAVALGDLAGRVGNGAVAVALLDQFEVACEGGVSRPMVLRRGANADVLGLRTMVLGGDQFRIQRSPEFQTLSVPEAPPDTICFPSGENCTELMPYGSAALFSALRSSVAARDRQKRQQ